MRVWQDTDSTWFFWQVISTDYHLRRCFQLVFPWVFPLICGLSFKKKKIKCEQITKNWTLDASIILKRSGDATMRANYFFLHANKLDSLWRTGKRLSAPAPRGQCLKLLPDGSPIQSTTLHYWTKLLILFILVSLLIQWLTEILIIFVLCKY